MKTVLTDVQIEQLRAKAVAAFDGTRQPFEIAARAIEQAVLQSDQVQAWKRDSESMRGALKEIATMDSMSYHSLESAKIVAKAAMGEQP